MELKLNKKVLQIKGASKGLKGWNKFEVNPDRAINGDEEFEVRLKVEVFEIGQRNLQDGTFDKVHYAKIKEAELIM
jgi:hypothetical protein